MLLSVADSGTSTYQESCGHTATHRTRQQERSLHFCYLECTSDHPQRWLIYHQHSPLTTLEDYCEEMMVSLSSARDLAAKMIQKAQTKYKKYYDQKAKDSQIRVGEWLLVQFPQDESGRNRKLSNPWHGPYYVTSLNDTTSHARRFITVNMGNSVFTRVEFAIALPVFQRDITGMVPGGRAQDNLRNGWKSFSQLALQ